VAGVQDVVTSTLGEGARVIEGGGC
jgi:hypothetical protein